MDRNQISVGSWSCPVDGPRPRLNHPGAAVEQHALKTTTSLLDSVDGLLDARKQRPAVSSKLLVPWGQMTEDDFPADKGALEVGSNKIDATHAATLSSRVRKERSGLEPTLGGLFASWHRHKTGTVQAEVQ